jgi:phosphoribosylglycinamide formyltransferase-1
VVKHPYRVGFCLSGGGGLFQAAVRQRAQLGIEVAAAFTARKDEGTFSRFCRDRNIPLYVIDQADRGKFDEELTERSMAARLDLIALTFDKIIPPAMVAAYRGRIINMHAGLLPAFRGPRPLEDALQAGVRFAGATMHEVDELVDHGPVIAQCVVSLDRDEPLESISQRLYPLVKPMFLQTIAWFAQGRIEKDSAGRIWVRGARYGGFPISPEVELAFPDPPAR